MVRLSSISFFLCLSLGISAADIKRRWINGNTATGCSGNSAIEGCEYWVNDIDTGDSCETIKAYFGITKKQFLSWNPSVPQSCALVRGWSYCVAGPDDPVISSSTTATSTPAGTLTYSGTAAPTQSGVFSSCKSYYLVQDSDTCNTIQDKLMTFTLGQFYSWNPSISKGCKGLQVGYYVCIDVTSSASSSSAAATPTIGHQPHQTGIPSNCNSWHFVVKNDSCATIASKFDITNEKFYQMNPATGSTCSNLWLSNYVCVGVSGSSSSSSAMTGAVSTKSATSTSTSSTKSTNSGDTPGPTGSRTVADCVEYYEAQSGDRCWSIVNEKYTYLTQALFTEWNPSLGDACSLVKDQYYCVAIKTAQPMAGTIDTCTSWHLVASDDSCWTIEQKYDVTPAHFNAWNPKVGTDCAGLWLGYYVCVDA
ncbi:unnamed protein product [Penicillium salamii]|uniref:LysM domain-containing protein n=1 Tax=Penicillium salamii TaxID=1612424 RepID=A0A9W4J9D4_9EURO|nr:unnamed protein product [Penicillium salamii]CAG8075866.1 unnamed protein product [Penicillium salamii]CAG8175496.1 unnamed protein product [Penicillium salamii]CAG8224436.1 unnamed protein product [Penicillium salamii]CAG8312532.1 unnamed protein product [Penicillium salamii]